MLFETHPSAPDYGQLDNAILRDESGHLGDQKVKKNSGGQKADRPKKNNQGPLSSGNNNTPEMNSSGSGDAAGNGGSSQNPGKTTKAVGVLCWECVSC